MPHQEWQAEQFEIHRSHMREVARRMLDYPRTLDGVPVLAVAVQCLANPSPRSRALYDLVYPLGRLGLPAALWSLKLATAGASVLCAALTAACAKRLGRPPLTCALVVGLNPVLIVYGVGGVHNDFLMMAVWLAGLFFTLGLRERLGAVAVAVW